MNFCIILPSQSDQILLVSPVLRALIRHHKASSIYCIGSEEDFFFLQHRPEIDKLLSFHSEELIELAKEEDTYWADLRKDDQSHKILKQYAIKAQSYKSRSFATALYQGLGINFLPDRHLAEIYFEAFSSLGLEYDEGGLDYFIPVSEEIKESDLPASHHLGYVVMVLTGRPKEKLSAKQIQEFCRQLHHPVILLGERKEFEWGEAIASFDPVKVYNACGKFSLQENADMIRRAKMIITSYNHYLHIASAFKKEIIFITGKNLPALGRAPLYPEYMLKKKEKPFQLIAPYSRQAVKQLIESVEKRLAKPFKL